MCHLGSFYDPFKTTQKIKILKKVLNLIQEIKENKVTKVKKYKENLSLISSIMLRKLRPGQKNGFLIKKNSAGHVH